MNLRLSRTNAAFMAVETVTSTRLNADTNVEIFFLCHLEHMPTASLRSLITSFHKVESFNWFSWKIKYYTIYLWHFSVGPSSRDGVICHSSVTSAAADCAWCVRERPERQEEEEEKRGEKRRKAAARRETVTVFLLPAGNELVKGKSE